MKRKRDPNRKKAFELFQSSDGSISNKELATRLDVPEKTISAWKFRDKWNEVLQSKNCSTSLNDSSTSKKAGGPGAPQKNQNAKGNRGNSRASPPKQNKNALKTGEYETIFFDTLSNEEKEIFSSIEHDPFLIMSEEVRLLKIRQLRMMQRIKNAENDLTEEEVERLQQLRKVKTPIKKNDRTVEVTKEEMQDVQVTRKTYRKIDNILALEEALTRVSNQLTKAIKELNAISMNEMKNKVYNYQAEKLEIEVDLLKLRALVEKQELEDEESAEDDGFLDALENEGAKLWPE